jgi:cyanobactin maturation PatA/PatG family protease
MNPVVDIPGLRALWQKASGGDPSVRIAIIDGPADLGHSALDGARVTRGGDIPGAPLPVVRSEHGTHVTSILMGTPGGPVNGVAPNCSAMIYSIYREDPAGELEPSSQATLALAINQALADGADVINISSGQQTPTGQADRILADAVRRCADAGKLIIAAAGNDGCRCVQVPGSLPSVLAVGACDLSGKPLPFSNFGDPYLDNGIIAPGDGIAGASPVHHVVERSGTSFATPIVTGVVALLLSALRQDGKEADPRKIRAALLNTAVPCDPSAADDARCLVGRLDIPRLMEALLGTAAKPDDLVPSAAESSPRNYADRSPIGPQPHPFYSAQRFATREAPMGDLSVTSAPSASRILGPDGAAIRSSSGVLPSEAQIASPPAGVTADAAPAAVMPAAASPMGGGVVWVPMSMMPSGVVPAGVMPPQLPAMTPSAAPSLAPQMPAALYEARPAVRASETGCGCGVRPAEASAPAEQMAFPIGQIFYDFGKEARLDYFVQAIASWRDSLAAAGRVTDQSLQGWFGSADQPRDTSGDTAAPYNPEIMVRYLRNLAPGEATSPNGGQNLPDADALMWTLTIDTIPIYAIKPLDVFGLGFYISLIMALWNQEVSPLDPGSVAGTARSMLETTPASDGFPPIGSVTRVSFAGWVNSANTTRLLNGTVVPTLVTDWRGFYQWNLDTLLGDRRTTTWPDGAAGFLERIYNEFRNVGIAPQDRALNYSAMNAYNTKRIFASIVNSGLKLRLDTLEVDRSTICRADSDCWDVTYRFFDPTQVLTQARRVYQYTIDVSDVVPVAVGVLRQWEVY